VSLERCVLEQDNIVFAAESNSAAPLLTAIMAWICELVKCIDDRLRVPFVGIARENFCQKTSEGRGLIVDCQAQERIDTFCKHPSL
jgi:hypothetical protein